MPEVCANEKRSIDNEVRGLWLAGSHTGRSPSPVVPLNAGHCDLYISLPYIVGVLIIQGVHKTASTRHEHARY